MPGAHSDSSMLVSISDRRKVRIVGDGGSSVERGIFSGVPQGPKTLKIKAF
jgi:hypothetical protein